MASSQMSFLGLELSHNKLRVSPARAWRVRLALEFAMNKRFISPAGLEIIVGHIVWQFMCRRELLSILSAVYTHIHTEPRTTALPMSDLLCTELRHVIGLLPLCFTNLSAPWSDVVHATYIRGCVIYISAFKKASRACCNTEQIQHRADPTKSRSNTERADPEHSFRADPTQSRSNTEQIQHRAGPTQSRSRAYAEQIRHRAGRTQSRSNIEQIQHRADTEQIQH